MDGHITIYGYISTLQDNDPGQWGEVNLKAVQDQINSQPNAEQYVVHINSGGGDVSEGFAIHDVLVATGKKIITQIEGMCASIATVIALAGDERRMTENSQFMIHLPMTWGEGTADDLQKQADEMKKLESRVLDFYVEKTGSAREAISTMMKAETWLSADQAKQLGFITEITATMKAVATIKNRDIMTMTAEDFEKKFEEVSKKQSFVQKLMALIKATPKMMTLTTADGTILDFGDAVQDESQIVVGVTATVAGSPANGSYVLTDGRTLNFVEGTLTEIVEAAPEETVETLKAQLAEKDAKIAELETAKNTASEQLATMTTKVGELQNEFKEFKVKMRTDMGVVTPESKETPEEPGASRKPFKDKE